MRLERKEQRRKNRCAQTPPEALQTSALEGAEAETADAADAPDASTEAQSSDQAPTEGAASSAQPARRARTERRSKELAAGLEHHWEARSRLLPLLLRDESYTTKDVEETGIMLLKRDFKKDGVIDELVAANMLQDVLDEMPSSL